MRRIKDVVAAAVPALAGCGRMPAYAQELCIGLDLEVILNGTAGIGPIHQCLAPPAG